jgi:RimJ/RimL family protein N-acetyltransferase
MDCSNKVAPVADEPLFARRINCDPVATPRGVVPARTTICGASARLEPLDAAHHTSSLYRLGHDSQAALESWQYLPWGPFATEAAMCAQLRSFSSALDRIFYAVCDSITGEAVGMATYLDIQPSAGVIEIGGIWFAPAFQRTRAATEAMFLMLAYAMDELGYRRMQWRCNALNSKSRAAARRLGFRFEGIWFNHMIVKGQNRDTAWYSILDTEWPAVKTAIEAWLDPTNFDAQGNQRRSLSTMIAARC